MVRPFKFLCLGLFALLALAPASAAAKAASYTVARAQLDVEETHTYKSTSKVSWTGNGHQHETLLEHDPELPSLPFGIPAAGGGIPILTDRLLDGDETLIDAEGKKEECSGVWEEEANGSFTVRIKPKGGKLEASWEIPHGISSRNCGAQRDLMPSRLIVKSTANGEIGDRRLVLATSGAKTKSSNTVGTESQTVKWKATVVLTRAGSTTPKPPTPPIHR